MTSLCVKDPTKASFGVWVPQPLSNCPSFDLIDHLMVRDFGVGMICGGDGHYYPYVMGIRLGSYPSLEDARADVEKYAKLAEPFINAMAERG